MSCFSFASIDVGPGSPNYIPKSYEDSRSEFIRLSSEALKLYKGRLESYPLSRVVRKSSIDTINLSIDVLFLGEHNSNEKTQLLIHSSGVHGVEGFAGCAIQLNFLHSIVYQLNLSIPSNVGIVIIHCVNPYGMATLRRFNSNNVDLNRNFLLGPNDFSRQERPSDIWYNVYNEILKPDASYFSPGTLLDSTRFWAKCGQYLMSNGTRAMSQVICAGQFVEKDGLFYGGRNLEEESLNVIDILKSAGITNNDLKDLIFIDVHTGLGGVPGRDTLLSSVQSRPFAEKLFGKDNFQMVGADTIYEVNGELLHAAESLVSSSTNVACICQEFGTKQGPKVLNALRLENAVWWNWWRNDVGFGPDDELVRSNPPVEIPSDNWAKKDLLKAFAFMDDVQWALDTQSRGKQVLCAALRHLKVGLDSIDDSDEIEKANSVIGPTAFLANDEEEVTNDIEMRREHEIRLNELNA